MWRYRLHLPGREGMTSVQSQLTKYQVWDRTVRIFHWVNMLCILGLIAFGTVILNSKALDVSGDGKVILKTLHVYIGYVFVLNLVWRLIWSFIGNRFARWKTFLPVGVEYNSTVWLLWRVLKTVIPPSSWGIIHWQDGWSLFFLSCYPPWL